MGAGAMNCPGCFGRLWIEDYSGDWFRCGYCDATGEPNHATARIYSLSDARAARHRVNFKTVVQDTEPDKAG